jgi:hypothetical protein
MSDRPPLQPTPAPPGAADPPIAVDIAAPERIRAGRRRASGILSELALREMTDEERRGAGRTLSAAELRLARAIARFLGRAADRKVPEVDGAGFIALLETDLALVQLGRAAGELEATAAVGELVLKGRLTALNDRVFLYAGRPDAPPKERDELRICLASADLIYEREQQLLRTRRERAALRRQRYEAALAASQEESERLRRRGELMGAAHKKEEGR